MTMASRPSDIVPGLLDRLARGDPAVLDDICRRYGSRVRAIASRHLGDRLRRRLETDDVAQDAMADIIKAAPGLRFPNEASFIRWVSRIVEHRILRAARYWAAERRRPSRVVRLSTTKIGAGLDDRFPADLLARREDADRVVGAIAALRPDDRRVIVARLLLDLSWADTAAALGATEQAAQMRLVRARRRLAAALGDRTP